MESKNIRIQVIILFLLILANFIAQIPYYLLLKRSRFLDPQESEEPLTKYSG